MISPAMPRNMQFRIETLYTKRGRVGVIRPDAQGVYKGLPMMTLGETTQQNTYYDPQSMVDQITNPETNFSKRFCRGQLAGEYGHPLFIQMSDADKIVRLTTIDDRNVSHLFTGIYTDAPSADGTVVVRADIKPSGPMGQYLKNSLDDPISNTAFSLRAFVDTKMNGNLKFRTVRALTTWDTVVSSGYKGSDKAHGIGLESFSGDNFLEYEINVTSEGNLVIDQIALETLQNTDLNEIFGTNDIHKIVQSRTWVKTDKPLAERFPNLYRTGIFNEYFREG